MCVCIYIYVYIYIYIHTRVLILGETWKLTLKARTLELLLHFFQVAEPGKPWPMFLLDLLVLRFETTRNARKWIIHHTDSNHVQRFFSLKFHISMNFPPKIVVFSVAGAMPTLQHVVTGPRDRSAIKACSRAMQNIQVSMGKTIGKPSEKYSKYGKKILWPSHGG